MENIRQAVERAKARPEQRGGAGLSSAGQQIKYGFGDSYGVDARVEEIELDPAHLQSKRMIAYDKNDPRARSFEMLRTQVLRSMDLKEWTTLAVTSPTQGCGKTLTAINLALSIARLPERQVLLVDMDLRRPQIANCLGLVADQGLLGVLEGRVSLNGAMIRACIGNCKFQVLPTASTSHSSDFMASSAMSTLLQDIARGSKSQIAILDLPPLLTGDDVFAILPQLDCVLLVAAVGTSTVSEIDECRRHLQSTDVVRYVVNKAPESSANYNYY